MSEHAARQSDHQTETTAAFQKRVKEVGERDGHEAHAHDEVYGNVNAALSVLRERLAERGHAFRSVHPDDEDRMVQAMIGLQHNTENYLRSSEGRAALGAREILDLSEFEPDQAAAIQQEVRWLFQATPDETARDRRAKHPDEEVLDTSLDHTKLVFVYGDTPGGTDGPLQRIIMWRQRDFAPTAPPPPRSPRTAADTMPNLPVADTRTDTPIIKNSRPMPSQRVEAEPLDIDLADKVTQVVNTQDMPVQTSDLPKPRHRPEAASRSTGKPAHERGRTRPGERVHEMYQEVLNEAARLDRHTGLGLRGAEREVLVRLIRERQQSAPDRILPQRAYNEADERQTETRVMSAMSRALNGLSADKIDHAILYSLTDRPSIGDQAVMDEIFAVLQVPQVPIAGRVNQAPPPPVIQSIIQGDGVSLSIETRASRIPKTFLQITRETGPDGIPGKTTLYLMKVDTDSPHFDEMPVEAAEARADHPVPDTSASDTPTADPTRPAYLTKEFFEPVPEPKTSGGKFYYAEGNQIDDQIRLNSDRGDSVRAGVVALQHLLASRSQSAPEQLVPGGPQSRELESLVRDDIRRTVEVMARFLSADRARVPAAMLIETDADHIDDRSALVMSELEAVVQARNVHDQNTNRADGNLKQTTNRADGTPLEIEAKATNIPGTWIQYERELVPGGKYRMFLMRQQEQSPRAGA